MLRYQPTLPCTCQLAALEASIEQIKEDHGCPIFLRGDCNVNANNHPRAEIFKHFCTKLDLVNPNLNHPTYHHFIGDGKFDSQLDQILSTGSQTRPESLKAIVCKLSNTLVQSHHDIIVTVLPLPIVEFHEPEAVVLAPKIKNDRVRIIWEDENIDLYQSLISSNLSSIRDRWADASSPSCISILLSSTNDALSSAAKASNKFVKLSKSSVKQPVDHPEVRAAQRTALQASEYLHVLNSSASTDPGLLESARAAAASSKTALRRISRKLEIEACYLRESKLYTILQNNPSGLFKSIKAFKSNSSTQIQKLNVGKQVYSVSNVPDGFFQSLSTLKAPDMSSIHSSPSYKTTLCMYEHILKICNDGLKIPEITPTKAMELLISLKLDVNDLYSITPRHYLNAGMEGAEHFSFILNLIIKNVNLSTLEELNSVWAMVLHKGHGKDRESDRSYRTISTCPFLAKALDKYVGSLYESGWAAAQAPTQFQGTGSSHELAALLLTESIEFSLLSAKKPLFCIFLDAKSAFDKILREFCIKSAYLAGSTGQGLLYLDNRMKHRQTYVEWDKVLMGPIKDLLGVEQGGCNSDKMYKLANNKELIITQDSKMGLLMGPIHVASIGQADDVCLLSDDIYRLQCILLLALKYAEEYHVEMVPEKTKLICFTPRGQESQAYYWKVASPISMAGQPVSFSDQAEHVGILRSTLAGKMDNVIARQAAHTKALYSVLPAGLARGHHGNPAAALRVERLYGSPVLLSGLAALVLSQTEQSSLDLHFKIRLESLQRLYKATPAPVVHYLAGSLPASAILHLRQFSLLGMIARLGPQNILHQHGSYILSTPSSTTTKFSWFCQVRSLCQQYFLPDPLQILQVPPTKESFKRQTKQHVLDWWNVKLRADVARLDSLVLFRASFMSLSIPHPIWTSAGSSSYEIQKATVQARMLSGRYRTCWLRRHWSGDQTGFCRIPGCSGVPGTLQHLATGECTGLGNAYIRATALWTSYLKENPILFPIIRQFSLADSAQFLSFLVDPTTLPPVIALAQTNGSKVISKLYYMTRTWLYYMHKERLKLLNLWS